VHSHFINLKLTDLIYQKTAGDHSDHWLVRALTYVQCLFSYAYYFACYLPVSRWTYKIIIAISVHNKQEIMYAYSIAVHHFTVAIIPRVIIIL
jgi:CRISPR/Cas system-associated endonuclease Cas3-HD